MSATIIYGGYRSYIKCHYYYYLACVFNICIPTVFSSKDDCVLLVIDGAVFIHRKASNIKHGVYYWCLHHPSWLLTSQIFDLLLHKMCLEQVSN